MKAETAAKRVLCALGVEDTVQSSRLKEDCGLDSLSLVSVMVGLEEELGISFDDSDLDPATLLTVGDIVALTEKYV